MKRVIRKKPSFYAAQLNIKILTRSKESCNQILDTIAHVAECMETEQVDTAVITFFEVKQLNETGMRAILDELNLESDEIGLG